MSIRNKTFFASDFHLGIPDYFASLEREKTIVRWLNNIAPEALHIYLVGDLFDFWFEYKHVVPKGYVRLLGKLAELKDSGIQLHIFTGNHDLWMFDYFEKELGISVYRTHVKAEINEKKFFIGHGDGIGPGDRGYKMMKKIFANKLNQRLFSLLHPDFAMRIANYWSAKSRYSNDSEQFLGGDKEWQIIYAKEILEKEHFDYFIFGHRHIPIYFPLKDGSVFINLGDWVSQNSYAVFDGDKIELKYFEK